LIGSFDVPVLGTAALMASLLGSVAGSGGTAVLLPILVIYVGLRDAIPILTIANLSSNLGRVWFNRPQIVMPVVGWFALGAIPFALSGAMLFVIAPTVTLTRILGAFLLVTLAWRRFNRGPRRIKSAGWFAPLGAGFGLLAGLLEGVGPLMAPFFLAYGLVRGAYIGTDALATVLMQVSKLAVFGEKDLIDSRIVASGLILVPFMIAGAFAGKKIVDRIPESLFLLIIDVTLLLAGVKFLLAR
jgi:uncharacterized membrane protein YfcA